MKIVDDIKASYDKADTDDKPILIFVGILAVAVVILVVVGILALLFALAKAVLPYVIGGAVLWFLVRWFTGASPLDWAKKLKK